MRIESLPIDMNRQRAIWAYEIIKKILKNNELKNEEENHEDNGKSEKENSKRNKQTELKSLCRRLPTMLKGNGLLTTLYYLKKNDGNYNLYKHIINIIRDIPFIEANDNNICIEELLVLPDAKYRMVQKEVMEYAIWLKKTAEAMISD